MSSDLAFGKGAATSVGVRGHVTRSRRWIGWDWLVAVSRGSSRGKREYSSIFGVLLVGGKAGGRWVRWRRRICVEALSAFGAFLCRASWSLTLGLVPRAAALGTRRRVNSGWRALCFSEVMSWERALKSESREEVLKLPVNSTVFSSPF